MAGPSRRRGVCGRGFAILKYLRYGVKSQRYPILTCPLYPHAWIRLENLNLKNGIRHPSSRPWPIWLLAQGVSVAMESTHVYWILVYELLESYGIEVVLVNARQLHNSRV